MLWNTTEEAETTELGESRGWARSVGIELDPAAVTSPDELDGGLMFYGANVEGLYRRLGSHADRILKGATPAELLVERATQLDFVINREGMLALGVNIPRHVRQQAELI